MKCKNTEKLMELIGNVLYEEFDESWFKHCKYNNVYGIWLYAAPFTADYMLNIEIIKDPFKNKKTPNVASFHYEIKKVSFYVLCNLMNKIKQCSTWEKSDNHVPYIAIQRKEKENESPNL